MKKGFQVLAVFICSVLGILAGLYVGLILMIYEPVMTLIDAFSVGQVTAPIVIINLMKILLSSTAGGTVWIICYIFANYFRGDEDPDWDKINARIKKDRED